MPRLILAILSTCVVMTCTALLAQDVEVSGNRSTLQQIKEFPLKGDARGGFREFRRKGAYFGAIYVNRPERTFGHVENVNSIALAEGFARDLCHARSKNAQYCVLYARIIPKRYDATAVGRTLSHAANKEFREYTKLQNKKRFGAFATSDAGAVGYSWAEASPEAAQTHALRRCQKSARKLLRAADDDLKPLIASPLRQTCQPLHQSP